MSSKLAKQNRIVNPFAKNVLSLKVNDELQTELDSKLPPRETVKILLNLAVDLMMGYTDQLVEFHLSKKSNGEDELIQRPVRSTDDNDQHEEARTESSGG
jgi:hypothetical protein